MCMQVLNVDASNSLKNVIAILCLDGMEYHDNLKKTIGPLNDDISRLQSSSWHGKRLRVFTCGDYDFLCKVYGISGARGSYCCIWCNVETKFIQLERSYRGVSAARKFSSLRKQHRRFVQEGGKKKNKAALYENVIHAPLLNIRNTHVCPPHLHILLEENCNKIDCAIAVCLAKSNGILSDSVFHKYVKQVQDINKVNAEESQLALQLEQVDESTSLARLLSEEQRIKKEIVTLD